MVGFTISYYLVYTGSVLHIYYYNILLYNYIYLFDIIFIVALKFANSKTYCAIATKTKPMTLVNRTTIPIATTQPFVLQAMYQQSAL